MQLNNYSTIFIDFDGVICDSNRLKRENIKRACLSSGIESERTLEFVDYFTSRNGIPREVKTMAFFQDADIASRILSVYAENNNNLLDAPLLPGVKSFLTLTNSKRCFILSGGNKEEIQSYLVEHDLQTFFDCILCGPKKKEEHLRGFKSLDGAFFIGDSAHDYEVAKMVNLPFIFMFAATQLSNWNTMSFQNTLITQDFNTLINQIK